MERAKEIIAGLDTQKSGFVVEIMEVGASSKVGNEMLPHPHYAKVTIMSLGVWKRQWGTRSTVGTKSHHISSWRLFTYILPSYAGLGQCLEAISVSGT